MIGDSYDFRSERELREQLEENECLLDELFLMSNDECIDEFGCGLEEMIERTEQTIEYLKEQIEEMESEDRRRDGLDPAFGSWKEVNMMFYKKI